MSLVPLACHDSRSPSSALQSLLDGAVQRNKGLGGGIVRIESAARGVLWEGASGNRFDGEPIAASDAFEVASVGKTFTAACVLMLVEEGRLRLDQPIGELLTPALTGGLLVIDGHDYGPEISLRQLLGHTSGLPDYWTDPPAPDGTNAFLADFLADADRLWRPEETIAYARRLYPIAAPGARYHYGDTGYVLLGLVLERATGRKLHELLRERVIAPLGLRDTYFAYYEPAPSGEREAHRFEGELDLYGQRRQSAEWAAGGLVSSARDLSRFILALARGELFKQKVTLTLMQAWTGRSSRSRSPARSTRPTTTGGSTWPGLR
jgi:D-alanyl-D-alanine carboxypeptidase